MKKYLKKETITPLVTFILLTMYAVAALRMVPPIYKGVLQSSFFPLLIYIVGAPTALLVLRDGIKKLKNQTVATDNNDEEQKEVTEKGTIPIKLKPFLIIVISSLLVFFFEKVGFFLTAPLYVLLFMLVYDDKPQGFVRKLIYSLFICAFVYVLYVYVFDIRFPHPWG